jgi:hypothetical protein
MLSFLRMQGALVQRDPAAAALQIDEPTADAIHAASHLLFAEAGEPRQALVGGLMTGEGEFQGVLRT